jgi:hypothetical protein
MIHRTMCTATAVLAFAALTQLSPATFSLAVNGTLTINARSKTATSVAGTIKCQAFTPAIAGGGD